MSASVSINFMIMDVKLFWTMQDRKFSMIPDRQEKNGNFMIVLRYS